MILRAALLSIAALGLLLACSQSESEEKPEVEVESAATKPPAAQGATESAADDASDSAKESAPPDELAESATFQVEILRVSFIGSAAHGSGTLFYGDKSYKFKASGLGAGGFGASKTTLRGTVYNLMRWQDFAGTYANVRSGIAVGEKDMAKSIFVQNEKGVKLKGKPDTDGVQLNLGADGFLVTWD